jgi:hypothetical protein
MRNSKNRGSYEKESISSRADREGGTPAALLRCVTLAVSGLAWASCFVPQPYFIPVCGLTAGGWKVAELPTRESRTANSTVEQSRASSGPFGRPRVQSVPGRPRRVGTMDWVCERTEMYRAL